MGVIVNKKTLNQEAWEAAQIFLGLTEDTAWAHHGAITSITLKREGNGRYRLSVTAQGRRGKYYVIFNGRSPLECLEDYTAFLWGKSSTAKWRKSKY